ncbi:TPA: NADH/ubiquinone/plastoquinone (complex I) [Candidatus Latescibacteria bacterium]|nr:NADH/ubiquinone/plastoquinone (complex I) [Candidatus Latescibacterota bacterium]|tara:strand:+ start:347 stop:1831 length:1485 start_codon:yes stop_codon:yes gene_type:complete
MPEQTLPVLIPAIYLGAGILILLIGLRVRSLVYPLAVLASGAAMLISLRGLFDVMASGPMVHQMGGWAPPVGIVFVLDHLSAFVTSIVTSIGFLVMVYAKNSILDDTPRRFTVIYSLAMLLLSGLTGMVLTGDMFNFYVWLEISSLAAYALIAAGDRRGAVGAFRYLILGSLGGGFYLLGVGFLYFATGTLNMADLANLLPALHDSRVVLAGAAMIVLGLGLKMALFPLHLWLPDAYAFAPQAVSSLIAPIMTKVAAYGLIRMVLDVFGVSYMRDSIPVLAIVGWLGAIGIIVGSVWAMAQKDYRRMLAFSSVSQVGYIAVGIGLGTTLGMVGALLHVLNHATMKACLFLVGGSVRLKTKALEVAQFGGLGRQMKWTMVAFTIGAMSMIGVPPTAGFFSKWYLVRGGIQAGNWIFIVVILISSLLTAIYFFRLIEQVYRDESQNENAPEPVGEAPASMFVPTVVLAFLLVALGFGNAVIVTHLLEPVASAVGGM